MLHRLLALVLKEMQVLLRDPQSRKLLIVPVILQLALFPHAATLEVRNSTLAILRQDEGADAQELIHRVSQAQAFTEIRILGSQQELTRCIENQEALLAMQIPEDFGRKLERGESPSLQVILDGRRSNSGQIAQGYLQQIIQTFMQDRNLRLGLPTPPSRLVVRHAFNPNLIYVWSIVPGLVAIITTTITLVVSALSIGREREQGTLEQLMVSPLTPGMIMVGKTIPAILVSAFQATLILGGGVFLYGVPFQGSLFLLYLGMLVYTLTLVGFGFLIASICSTQQQAFLGIFSFIMPAILLSGFASPVDNMPGWLQALTWFNPLRHFIIIVKGVFLKQMNAAGVFENLWPLILIGTVTLAAARLMFQRKTA